MIAGSPSGVILVAHEVLTQITQDEMLAALPAPYRGLPREIVALRAVTTTLRDLATLDWATARRLQLNEVRERLLPIVEANPTWRVQYFGAAPIPLAMDLGYLLGGWDGIDIYQQRHDTNSWEWPQAGAASSVRFVPIELGDERIAADGDVVVRVSVSHRIDPADTVGVISHSLGEIDLALEQPGEDALKSPADLEALKSEFDAVIDWAHRCRPNAQLHVFAAVPVGAAVRLGMAVNPTIHAPVHAYQYSSSATPRYRRALVLQRPIAAQPALTAEQVATAVELRGHLADELDAIRAATRALGEKEQTSPKPTWVETVLSPELGNAFQGSIRGLAKIFETPMLDSSVDRITTAVADAFCYDPPSRLWRLDDRFLSTLAAQITDDASRRQAGRLLLLHEGVHLKTHGLTGATAPQIRRFPKIVEEVDYQADVWAFVHDYALQGLGESADDERSRKFFLNVVSVALNVFWAFDAAGDRDRIEIRRLNRYLIWYWQLLRLEQCANLADVVSVLANRPLIEIAGPRVESSDDRVFYSLDPARFNEPELGLLYKQRIIRYGHAPGARVRDILLGFRERDSEKIRGALRSISDQVQD